MIYIYIYCIIYIQINIKKPLCNLKYSILIGKQSNNKKIVEITTLNYQEYSSYRY